MTIMQDDLYSDSRDGLGDEIRDFARNISGRARSWLRDWIDPNPLLSLHDGDTTVHEDEGRPLDLRVTVEPYGEAHYATVNLDGHAIFGVAHPSLETAQDGAVQMFSFMLRESLSDRSDMIGVERVTIPGPDEDEVIESDPDPDDDEIMLWSAGWAGDLVEGNSVRVLYPGGSAAEGVIQRKYSDYSRGDGFVYLIFFCINDPECEGHHWGGPSVAPVWVGHPVPGWAQTPDWMP